MGHAAARSGRQQVSTRPVRRRAFLRFGSFFFFFCPMSPFVLCACAPITFVHGLGDDGGDGHDDGDGDFDDDDDHDGRRRWA